MVSVLASCLLGPARRDGVAALVAPAVAMSVLLGQISRGLSPASAIAAAQRTAYERGWRYELIDTMPMADAKQRLAERALAVGRDLLLVEDDVIVPPHLWPNGSTEGVEALAVYFDNGELNIQRRRDGSVLWVGTCVMRIPITVLRRLDPPWFRPTRVIWHRDTDALSLGAPRADGRGSDVYFCYRCWGAGIPIEILGRATRLKHALTGTGLSEIELL